MLTVIIPWCDRPAIAESIQLNRDFLRNLEIIVVNVGGCREDLLGHVQSAELEGLRLIHISGTKFNKSLALNLGIHLATAEACLILDADVRLCEYDLHAAAKFLEQGAFVTLKRVVSPEGQGWATRLGLVAVRNFVELEFAEGGSVQVETSAFYNDGNSRSGPGVLLARKAWLTDISGFNSDLQGWGWEDIDVIFRLQKIGLQRQSLGLGWHLTEDAPSATVVGKHESEMRNRALAFRNYSVGNFRGTLQRDVKRCFNINMP